MSDKKRKSGGGRKPVPSVYEKVIKYSNGGKSEYRYNWSININQKVVADNKWDLDIIDVAIFNSIRKFISSLNEKESRLEKKTEDTVVTVDKLGTWYYVSEYKILKDIPLLPIGTVSGIYNRIKKLINCGLIERNPNNETSRMKLIRIGSEATKFDETNFKSTLDNN